MISHKSLRFGSSFLWKFSFTIFLLFLVIDSAYAQDSTKHKLKFHFSFDSYRSLISSEEAKLTGLKTGIEFHPKWITGLGFHFTGKPVEQRVYNQVFADTIARDTRLSYLSAYAEYILYRDRRFTLSIPLHLGVGSIKLEERYNSEKVTDEEIPIAVLSSSLQGDLKLIRWFGIGVGVGFRSLINDDEQLKEAYDSGLFIFKMKIYFGEIVTMIRERNERNARQHPHGWKYWSPNYEKDW